VIEVVISLPALGLPDRLGKIVRQPWSALYNEQDGCARRRHHRSSEGPKR
jgi:hypothetical protein